jgi:hypothetical protein
VGGSSRRRGECRDGEGRGQCGEKCPQKRPFHSRKDSISEPLLPLRARRACASLEAASDASMKPLLAAAVLAAALPGSAFGAGSWHGISRRTPRGGRFQPACSSSSGPTGAGRGSSSSGLRNLAGRWSAWRTFTPEDAGTRPRPREPPLTAGASQARSGPGPRTGSSTAPRAASPSCVRTSSAARGSVCAPSGPTSPARPRSVPRSGWGANESDPPWAPYYADSVHFAIVHHTAGVELVHEGPVRARSCGRSSSTT